MSNQGDVIRITKQGLKEKGWNVVYTCIPNTPHVGVIPIPTPQGSSEQRYPDIVATTGPVVRIVEVEINLTEQVVLDIRTRFSEMTSALTNSSVRSQWRKNISNSSGLTVVEDFRIEKDLVVCLENIPDDSPLVRDLHSSGIDVHSKTGLT
jgi:hypothetical protein